jgi:hypothetical protein
VTEINGYFAASVVPSVSGGKQKSTVKENDFGSSKQCAKHRFATGESQKDCSYSLNFGAFHLVEKKIPSD